MNFEQDEKILKKNLWHLKLQKLVKAVEAKTKYATTEEKEAGKEHRLHSDYIRVLYDDGLEIGIKASTILGKRKKPE